MLILPQLSISEIAPNYITKLAQFTIYVNGKRYSAVLINPVMQLRQGPNADSVDYIRLNEVVLSLYSGYTKLGRGVVYALPEIDTPQPDKNKIPPDMVRIPDTPDKGRAPLRTPWGPDKIPKKRNPTKKKRNPFSIVH